MSIPPPGPLAYEGQVVVPFIVRSFPPTTANNQFSVPTVWINPSTESAYILTGKPLGVANWLQFVAGGGNVGYLSGNTGGSVGPTNAGVINMVGDGTTITITGNPATHTLTASLIGGQEAMDSFQPDSGTNPVVPDINGLVVMSGSGSITTVGGLNSLTTQLTGLTNHAVLVGAGTTTITKVGPSATTGATFISGGAASDPGFSTTFTIVDSTGTSGVSKSQSGGTVSLNVFNTSNSANSDAALNISTGGVSARDAYAQYSVSGAINWSQGVKAADDNFYITSRTGLQGDVRLSLTTSGVMTINQAYSFPTADGTTGQVLTTNGAGTVSWATSGVGAWTDNSGVFTASRNAAYFLTAASTVTLPASPSQGDTIQVVCDTTGSCVITANTGQSIRISNQLSSVAGTATNSARGDSLALVYRSTGATWFADVAPNGGWTTA